MSIALAYAALASVVTHWLDNFAPLTLNLQAGEWAAPDTTRRVAEGRGIFYRAGYP
ncbi:hypothetical protein [Pectobacterium fontis]|uniref:hypothetical protein n=1 Tax=Pectobacterium fontis TaxID=2558042 RepID=UPI000B2B9296|nr:hypothetical protein [Pectobacterium fontis]